MAIAEGEWESIANLVRRMLGGRAEELITGKVTKVDANNQNVYMKEFGQQPIPMVANSFQITYYDTVWNPGTSTNKVVKKTAKVKLIMPGKGDTVVVAREMGTHRLPRCLGKLVGRHWILSGTD